MVISDRGVFKIIIIAEVKIIMEIGHEDRIIDGQTTEGTMALKATLHSRQLSKRRKDLKDKDRET